MADRYSRGRSGRQGYSRDDNDWRQQEQFSESWDQPDYEEGYGTQMSEPRRRGEYGQGRGDYETGWDRDTRYGQRGTGYSRGSRGPIGEGSYNYGPARFDAPGQRFSSFTSEDQGGRDFTAPTSRGSYGAYGSSYGGYGAGAGGGYGASRYGYRSDYGDREDERGWFTRAGDEIASWFGDEEAARRRRMDHAGRGPQNYTRSDERIQDDANDALTDDWGVDATDIQVSVENGEVTLNGTVSSRDQKHRAERCVEDISGVKHVQNNLRVQDSQRSTWDRSTKTGTETTG